LTGDRNDEQTYQGVNDVDMVPNLSPMNLACIETGKSFMLKHGYIKNDFDVWREPRQSFSNRQQKN
jgi:hypothetical protein